MLSLWAAMLAALESKRSTQSTFNQWISPLQAEESNSGLTLWAPNQYVLDGVTQDYLARISQLF